MESRCRGRHSGINRGVECVARERVVEDDVLGVRGRGATSDQGDEEAEESGHGEVW